MEDFAGAFLDGELASQRMLFLAEVTDDVLDVESTSSMTGKPANQDEKAGKSTFVSTMGKDQAKSRAGMLVDQACRHLNVFEGRADMFKELAQYVLQRRS